MPIRLRPQTPPPPPQPQGLAYEVHNVFNKIDTRRFLELIQQPNNYNNTNIYSHVRDTFLEKINTLFPNDTTKLEEINAILERINNSELLGRYAELIGKSIDFVFSQNQEFQRDYLNIFLNETCYAYSTGRTIRERMSCLKGIIERFVLAIGGTLRVLCAENGPNCTELYKTLDELFNPQFDLADEARKWVEYAETDQNIQNMNKEQRKEHFIQTLTNKARELLGVVNTSINQDIINYANNLDYYFENLQLGGKNKKHYKKTHNNKIQKKTYKKIHKKTRNNKIHKKTRNNKLHKKTQKLYRKGTYKIINK